MPCHFGCVVLPGVLMVSSCCNIGTSFDAGTEAVRVLQALQAGRRLGLRRGAPGTACCLVILPERPSLAQGYGVAADAYM